MAKKYLVKAGYVTSKNDGDQHYIGPMDLMKLYKVSPSECVIDNDRLLGQERVRCLRELIVLRPLYHGKYDDYLKGE